jgi:HAMP domain-containing protein
MPEQAYGKGKQMVNPSRKMRSLKNVKMTRKHHYQYFGLWICLFVGMLLALNGVTYLYVQERMGNASAVDPALSYEFGFMRRLITGVMFVEVALISTAFVVLAKFSAHRIAGPYIRLCNTFKQVENGDLSTRLRFRGTDRLEETSQAFNDMMEAVEKRVEVDRAAD